MSAKPLRISTTAFLALCATVGSPSTPRASADAAGHPPPPPLLVLYPASPGDSDDLHALASIRTSLRSQGFFDVMTYDVDSPAVIRAANESKHQEWVDHPVADNDGRLALSHAMGADYFAVITHGGRDRKADVTLVAVADSTQTWTAHDKADREASLLQDNVKAYAHTAKTATAPSAVSVAPAVTPAPTPIVVAPVVPPSPAPVVVAPVVTPSPAPVVVAPVVTPSPAPIAVAPAVTPAPAPVVVAPVVTPSPPPVVVAPVVTPSPAPVVVAPVVTPSPAPVVVAPVVTPSPAPIVVAPVVTPSPAPVVVAPVVTPSPAPVAVAPAVTPSPAPVAVAPALTPAPAPVVVAPVVTPSPAPVVVAPVVTPSPAPVVVAPAVTPSPAPVVVAPVVPPSPAPVVVAPVVAPGVPIHVEHVNSAPPPVTPSASSTSPVVVATIPSVPPSPAQSPAVTDIAPSPAIPTPSSGADDSSLNDDPAAMKQQLDAVRPLIARGDAAVDRGEIASAISLYRQAIDGAPLSVVPRLKLAQAYLQGGFKDKALSEAKRALQVSPDSISVQEFLIHLDTDENTSEGAVAMYEGLVEKNPNDPGVHVELGDAYWNNADLGRSESEYKIALHLSKPGDNRAAGQLARLYAVQSRYDDVKRVIAHIGDAQYPLAVKIIQSRMETLITTLSTARESFDAGKSSHEQLYDVAKKISADSGALSSFISDVTPPQDFRISHLHRKLGTDLIGQEADVIQKFIETSDSTIEDRAVSFEKSAETEMLTAHATEQKFGLSHQAAAKQ